MAYEVEVVKPRGRPNKTWKEVFVFDLRRLNLIAFDALDCKQWENLIHLIRGERGDSDKGSNYSESSVCVSLIWYQLVRAVLEIGPLNELFGFSITISCSVSVIFKNLFYCGKRSSSRTC